MGQLHTIIRHPYFLGVIFVDNVIEMVLQSFLVRFQMGHTLAQIKDERNETCDGEVDLLVVWHLAYITKRKGSVSRL